MLIDTHCHINVMVKNEFDVPLQKEDFGRAQTILKEATQNQVSTIINVGTSKIESANCIELANSFSPIFASVGIHPTDCTTEWQTDLNEIQKMLLKNKKKIVSIGECGIDRYHEGYDKIRQSDAFRAQIELALRHDLALIVHSRDAYDETLGILEQYKKDRMRGVIHCFSYDQTFADTVISWGFVLGIGATLTYPRNEILRSIVKAIAISSLVLETDAPFLPLQHMRGKQNHPKYIFDIAKYISELRNEPLEYIMSHTTKNAQRLFKLPENM